MIVPRASSALCTRRCPAAPHVVAPLAQTAPYLIGGRDPPKIFTATYNYTEKRYSQNSNLEKRQTAARAVAHSAAARGCRPRTPCHRASRHSRHTYKCTRNNLLGKEKRSVLCYDTLDLPLLPTHFSMLFCCSPPRSDPPPPPQKEKSLIPPSLVTPFASPVMKPMSMPTLLQMPGLKLKLHEFLPMLAPMLCM